MSVLSCLCRKVSLFFHAHKRKKCILICCFLCSIEVPVPLIRKVSVFKQKCAFIPIDTLGNTLPDRWLQVNFNLKSTWSPTFAISRNTWAAMACGRDSFYSWFPTGENQFVPGDSIDTQVVPWKADCEPRFSAMSVCLRLHLWSFPSCLGRSCREEKPFGHLSCVLSVAASSAAHVHAWGWLAAWKKPWKWKAVLLPAAIHLQSWGAQCPTALAPLHALLLLLHSPGYSVC